MQDLLDNGQYKPNRTGTGTYASVGHMLKYDLAAGFPAITTKKLAFKSVVGELLGFFRAYDNAEQFRALGCKVWDQNANETPTWVNNPERRGTDDLGRIYGVNWVKMRSYREARTAAELVRAQAKGYQVVGQLTPLADGSPRGTILFKEVNQLEDALRTLITDPFNRRIRITGWKPDELDLMALPACHCEYQFVTTVDKVLHATLTLRSSDVFLGLGFNISSFAVFTSIMARLAGLKPGVCTVFIVDGHIYENHIEAVKEQLTRSHFAAPGLMLSDRIKKIENLDDIAGVFERIEPGDIALDGYQSHAAIKAAMAV